MDIVDGCTTVISLVQAAIKLYDGYKENKAFLKEMEKHLRESQQLANSVKQKGNVLPSTLASMREFMKKMEKYMKRLSKKNHWYKFFFSGKVGKDLVLLNEQLKYENIKLGNAMTLHIMNTTDTTHSNIDNLMMNLQAVVMDKSKQSSKINEVDLNELKNKQLIHPGTRGRDIYSFEFHGEKVAVKMLGETPALTYKDIESFRKEIYSASSHTNKHIVQVYGASTIVPHLAIVMELMSGSLADLLYSPNKKILSWEEKIKIAIEVATGLQSLHKREILHRDLSSKNILYNQHFLFKIADLGLAKLISDPRSQNPGDPAKGSVAYLAPEVFESLAYSTKADIYSFGVVLWELAAAAPPRDGLTRDQIKDAVISGDREVIPLGTPDEIADLIGQCWAHDPDQRPDIEDVRTQLEGVVI